MSQQSFRPIPEFKMRIIENSQTPTQHNSVLCVNYVGNDPLVHKLVSYIGKCKLNKPSNLDTSKFCLTMIAMKSSSDAIEVKTKVELDNGMIRKITKRIPRGAFIYKLDDVSRYNLEDIDLFRKLNDATIYLLSILIQSTIDEGKVSPEDPIIIALYPKDEADFNDKFSKFNSIGFNVIWPQYLPQFLDSQIVFLIANKISHVLDAINRDAEEVMLPEIPFQPAVPYRPAIPARHYVPAQPSQPARSRQPAIPAPLSIFQSIQVDHQHNEDLSAYGINISKIDDIYDLQRFQP